MSIVVRPARSQDAAVLARIAAATFPLACPPRTTAEAAAQFVAAQLSPARFDDYLADPHRDVLLAEVDGIPAGYTMLVFAEPVSPDVVAAITLRPSIELNKCYVQEEQHGRGVAAALLATSVLIGRERGAAGMWLGVNQENPRANRFYEKNGFVRVGTRRFLVGDVYEDDFVRERAL